MELTKNNEYSNAWSLILPDEDYSELGTILSVNDGKIDNKFVENILTLSPAMESLLRFGQRMEKAEAEGEQKRSVDEQKNEIVYNSAQYNNNQIGDFLSWVEVEQNYRDNVEELSQSVETAKTELKEILSRLGYSLKDNFDLTKDEDYNMIVSKVKASKTNQLSLAKKEIDSIKTGSSDLLKESKESYGKVYSALVKDKDGLVPMSMTSDENNQLDEEIKSASANKSVDTKREDYGQETMNEQLKGSTAPYCPAY